MNMLTKLAVWWINRQWQVDQMPDSDTVPQLDGSNHKSIAIGPGVIAPPGLLIHTQEPLMDERGAIVALATWRHVGDTSHLLETRNVNTADFFKETK